MEKILSELLAEDKSLIFRNDELIALLEERIPPNLRREFSVLKIALKLNVGSFFVAEKDDHIRKYRAIKILLEGGMSEEKINFVLKTFENALPTSHESKEIYYLHTLFTELQKEVGQLKDENSSLKSQLDSQKSDIDTLKKIIATFNSHFKEIKSQLDFQKKILNTPTKSSEKTAQPPKQSDDKNTSTQQNSLESVDNFQRLNFLVKEFNYLSGLPDSIFTQKHFINKYSVLAFSCKNTGERMKNPSAAPIFVEIVSAQMGDFWAIHLERNFFAVFPYPQKSYNDNLHFERAMGFVFASNFICGKLYDKIQVEKPAIFEKNRITNEFRTDVWELRMRGLLKLE